ncbi:MAG: ABC transporter ATP-binding protein [Clostridia bacterium]
MNDIAVSFKSVSMQFPGVLANDSVSLDIKHGEVFALVGENGAGKSTLMNILYGLLTPTDGEVWVMGERMDRYSPKAAIDRGIGMVHQHFMLVPSFTVAQNVTLSREPRKHRVFFDAKKAKADTLALVAEYGLEVDPDARVDELSVGIAQRVEILKTLYRGADILILDEPTAVLTPHETDELFAVIQRIVRDKGMTVIIITHKLYEVMAISDRVGVMRQGRLVGVCDTEDVDERTLAAMMVGHDVALNDMERTQKTGEALLTVCAVTVQDNRGLAAVRDLTLTLHAGEILGIAAVEGNGQSELIEAITGLRPIVDGDISVCGTRINGLDPGAIRMLGLAHIPEDRLATGVSAASSIEDNLIIGRHNQREFKGPLGYMKRSSIASYAQELFKRFDIRAADIRVQAGSLSGGNMQKLVIAREFSFDSKVLIIAQPTRGVDIGAQDYIHDLIIKKRNAGCAVLLMSADLDEVVRLSDRIITMFEGKATAEFAADKADKAELGYYMTGAREAAK